jgi:hypothetical protein
MGKSVVVKTEFAPTPYKKVSEVKIYRALPSPIVHNDLTNSTTIVGDKRCPTNKHQKK